MTGAILFYWAACLAFTLLGPGSQARWGDIADLMMWLHRRRNGS